MDIWSEFAAPLRAFVARRAPSGTEPDDVLQDVFVRIQEQLPNLRDAERIDAWIFQIARNVLADLFRSRGRRDALVERSANQPAAAEAEDDERSAAAGLARCLTAMIMQLAEPYREAIMLTELCGMSQVEAARQVAISVSGMKSRVQRGREQLKKIIGGSCRIELDVRGGVIECDPRGGGGCSGTLRPPACSSDSMSMTNPSQTKETETTTNPTQDAASGCCGGAAPQDSGACCALDAEVKQSGGTGCGCGTRPAAPAPAAKKGCC